MSESPLAVIPEVLYESTWGPVAVGIVIGVLALIVSSYVLARPRSAWLKNRLAPHLEAGATAIQVDGTGSDAPSAFGAIFRGTERRLGDRKAWRDLSLLLWRADIKRRTVEVFYLVALSGLGLAVAASILTESILVAVLAAVAGVILPLAWLSTRAKKRSQEFDRQLPDLLDTLASSLKAGHTINHGMKVIVEDGQEPAATEFKRALADTGLGKPLDVGLAEMAARIRSQEFTFVLNAIAIQQEVGGSLADLLTTVAETVRSRQRFRAKIRGLTAMGRMSAYVLIALPFVSAIGLTLLRRDYMEPLFTTSTGRIMVIAGLIGLAIGAVILKKLTSFRG